MEALNNDFIKNIKDLIGESKKPNDLCQSISKGYAIGCAEVTIHMLISLCDNTGYDGAKFFEIFDDAYVDFSKEIMSAYEKNSAYIRSICASMCPKAKEIYDSVYRSSLIEITHDLILAELAPVDFAETFLGISAEQLSKLRVQPLPDYISEVIKSCPRKINS